MITVYAKQDTGEGAAGITAFLVETDTPGFNVGEPFPKLGLNTCPFCQLEFREVRVPKENIVGKPGAGFFILEHVMNWEILGIFMMMVGEMQWRMEACIDWAKKRSAFGSPIGSNQYVAGKIVDMKIGLENSRKHLYDTARRFAKGRSVTTEISMAKLITSEANLQSALSAVQIFGGTRLHEGIRHREEPPRRRRRPDLLGHQRDAARPDRLDVGPVGPAALHRILAPGAPSRAFPGAILRWFTEVVRWQVPDVRAAADRLLLPPTGLEAGLRRPGA